MPEAFACIVLTPQHQVLEKNVTYVSLPAWDGLIGIAAGRAPLTVKLSDGPLRLDLPDQESQRFFLGAGFAQMKRNRLVILANEAIPAAEIDAGQAKADLTQAQLPTALDDQAVAQRDRKANRARQMLRLAGQT